MSRPLKVGETAKLKNCDNFPEYNGTECVVQEGLDERLYSNSQTLEKEVGYRYIVLAYDSRQIAARPDQLEPKVETPEKKLNLEAVL